MCEQCAFDRWGDELGWVDAKLGAADQSRDERRVRTLEVAINVVLIVLFVAALVAGVAFS